MIYKIYRNANVSKGIPWLNNLIDKKENCKQLFCDGILIPFITFDIIEQLKSILTEKNIKQIKNNVSITHNNISKEFRNPMDGNIYREYLKNNNSNKLRGQRRS